MISLQVFFQSSKVSGKRDPFSVYLFVIVMVTFSCLFKRLVDRGFILGCRVKGRSSTFPFVGVLPSLPRSDDLPLLVTLYGLRLYWSLK